MRILEPRILGPNSGIEMLGPAFSNKKSPLKNSPPKKFTAQNSHQKNHPRIRAEKFTLHFCKSHFAEFKSGVKTDPVQFKGRFKQGLFAYKNGHFASSFLLLGIRFLEASKKANLSFKSPSPKPYLNRTGSVFAKSCLVKCSQFYLAFSRPVRPHKTETHECLTDRKLWQNNTQLLHRGWCAHCRNP